MSVARTFTFCLLFPTVFLLGCKKENSLDCVKSTGEIVTQIRPLPNFQTLRIFDNPEVIIIADSVPFVEVTAGKHLQENIQTEVKNGELFLRNINKCNWIRSYKKPIRIKVHVPKLKDIFHDGDGTLSSENLLPADTLFLHLTGAGDADLSLNTNLVWIDMYELAEARLHGKNRDLTAYILSQGSLKASELQNQNAYLKLSHQGQAFVEVSGLLKAEISGPGNVFYRNAPAQIQVTGPGPGEVKKLD